MHVLIVEDDPFKSSQIERELALNSLVEVRSASSLQDAMSTLSINQFDAVLLDMAIPSHGGVTGSADIYSQPVGGLDVLMHLALNDRPEKIMILTQYPTVEYNREHIPLSRLRAKFEADEIFNVLSVTMFADDGAWKAHLKTFLESIS